MNSNYLQYRIITTSQVRKLYYAATHKVMTAWPNVDFPYNLLSPTVPFLFSPSPPSALKTTNSRQKLSVVPPDNDYCLSV